ncbi:hypothetical protein Tco_0887647 [Tanacetum coccineum]
MAISFNSSMIVWDSPPSIGLYFFVIFLTVISSYSGVASRDFTLAPVISFVALMVEETLVASPTGLCGLVPYSGSDFDSPDEMSSLEHISPLPAISPFLCTNSSEAPDSSDGPPSQDPYVATVARWRSRTLHVGVYHLILQTTAHLLLVHLRTLCQFIIWVWMHQIRLILDLDKRFITPIVLPSEERTNDVERQFHRCVCPLSTLYPPTTLESSSGDSSERPMHSSSHYAGPSLKRYRSPIDYVPSSMLVMGSLAPTRADLLQPSIIGIETVQRQLEADQLIARGQRVSMIERIDSLRLENLKVHRNRDDTRDRPFGSGEPLPPMRSRTENQSQMEKTTTVNGDNGNGGNGNGRNENPDENVRGNIPVARECTYQDFMKCQPLNFKGTEEFVD